MKKIAISSMLALPMLCSMASACPLCRDSTATTGGSAQGSLFNASVLSILGAFLLVAIFLIAKVVGAVRLLDRSAVRRNETV